ncbi:hypothetical protein [Citrobacter freundii]|uniref:hypothetical protein n=1 Tax=Citrobacter freundii TaxID=546 RepID=UPI003F8D6861
MSEFKGTPGPWFWDEEGLGNKNHIVFGKEYPLEMTSKENKSLISAAPELLEALQAVVRVADRQTDEFDMARAAIAKALGK